MVDVRKRTEDGSSSGVGHDERGQTASFVRDGAGSAAVQPARAGLRRGLGAVESADLIRRIRRIRSAVDRSSYRTGGSQTRTAATIDTFWNFR